MNARAAVPLLARVERGAHQHAQLPIALGVGRLGSPAPRVIPAGRDPQHLAHRRNGKDRLPRVNQRERVAGSLAKKAAAFFKISRSSRSWRFSFRSRASSSRSAVVRPVRPLVRSAWARLTHSRKRRLGQIEIAGHGADGLPLIEHEADGAGFELIGELATRASLRCVGHRSGHRIPLWKDVHRIGSSPRADSRANLHRPSGQRIVRASRAAEAEFEESWTR